MRAGLQAFVIGVIESEAYFPWQFWVALVMAPVALNRARKWYPAYEAKFPWPVRALFGCLSLPAALILALVSLACLNREMDYIAATLFWAAGVVWLWFGHGLIRIISRMDRPKAGRRG